MRLVTAIAAVALLASALPATAATATTPTWTVSQDTTSPANTELTAVDCITATRCVAVGYRQTEDKYKSGIERGDGAQWSRMASPDPATKRPTDFPPMRGVSCAISSVCFGVGTYYNTSGKPTALIKHWNGSAWGIMKAESPIIARTPAVQRAPQTSLNSVSCPTVKSCYAVGSYRGVKGATKTLVEHLSGKTWAVLPSPTSSALATVLYGISCATDTNCFAVGTAISASHNKPFIIKWNGTKWSAVASPALPNAGFSGISCASTKFCVAIGGRASDSTTTLVEQWNGTKWSVAPVGMQTRNQLYGVSCPTATSCLAVGRGVWGVNYQTLALRWDGKKWTLDPPANQPGAVSNWLNSVSCTSATRCQAVGTYVIDDQLHSLVVQLG